MFALVASDGPVCVRRRMRHTDYAYGGPRSSVNLSTTRKKRVNNFDYFVVKCD